MRCIICLANPDVAKEKSGNGKLPKVATLEGRKFQSKEILDHHVSDSHYFCAELYKKNKESSERNVTDGDVENMPWIPYMNSNHACMIMFLDIFKRAKTKGGDN